MHIGMSSTVDCCHHFLSNGVVDGRYYDMAFLVHNFTHEVSWTALDGKRIHILIV